MLNQTYHIVLDPTVPPVIDASRKVPVALQHRLKEELKRMENMKIITPVSEPTEWVSSLVLVEKPNGSLRVCLDPRNLNKAIRRHHHKLPTTEDILSYWQVPLHEESS